MKQEVLYCQLNKDYAYWTEKRRVGQSKGGQVSGLVTYQQNGQVTQNLLFDTGLGTLEAIADHCPDSFWDEPLAILITHGHIDHHAELMILAEIYCQRRGKSMRDSRPPLPVYATIETQTHLFNTHRWGYTGGATLHHCPIEPGAALRLGMFEITPLAVDHFAGAVIYVIEFALARPHKIIVGWDTTTLPLQYLDHLRSPSLAFFEATTWTSMAAETGHSSIEDLVQTGFLAGLQLQFQPEAEQYGAYLVHYSGWEDPWGMLSDAQLKEKFAEAFPAYATTVQMAGRGQRWRFT